VCAAGFLQGLDPKLSMVRLGLGDGKVTFLMSQSHCPKPLLDRFFFFTGKTLELSSICA